MTDIIEETRKYWGHDYNCARAAARGILDYFEYFELSETIDKALMAFGGGFGERSICGAASGALAGLSTIMVERGIEKEKMGEIFKEFKTSFKEKNYTLYCRDIIEPYMNPDGSVDYDNPGRKEKCDHAVESAVLISKELIEKL
ncbi:MAG: C-GCAxxG-C-C family protein [Candidatus Heimdallarchaeaceae archaeon]